MRNLRNTRYTDVQFPEDGLPLTASTCDAGSDSVIYAFGPSENSPVIELKKLSNSSYTPEDLKSIASWDAPSPLPDLVTDKILSLHYFADTATICLILAGGDLVIVREEPLPGEDLIEIVGSVDDGITAAAWSPEEELVAISTRANTLIFMTRDFESVANVPLSPEDVKVSDHVSVGWGKKETQFHGKRAKALRDPTVPERVDEGLLSTYDHGETSLSWRGDGQYVALNATETIDEQSRRMIRVYTREGQLDSVSEPVDGLEGTLSWRPAGNLIAGIQRLSDRIDVVFLERNGLRHGQFTLRLSKEDMQSWASAINVYWNVDSTVLAVCFKDRIQLWTMGNYHYYLKQEILLPECNDPVRMSWHPEKALHLVAQSSNTTKVLNYIFTVSSGSLIPPNDLGLVAVVDGRVLKLTPLRLANVPPPMALIDLQVGKNVVDVAINKSATRIAVLYSDAIAVYSASFDSAAANPPQLVDMVNIPCVSESALTVATQIAYEGDNHLALLTSVSNSSNDRITIFSQDLADTLHDIDLAASCSALFPSFDYGSLSCQLPQGKIMKISSNSGSCSSILDLPAACPWIDVWSDEELSIVFGLSTNGTLYGISSSDNGQTIHERLRIRGCTSFLVTQAHLIYTTSQHLIKFVHLHAGDLDVPADEPEKDERCRAVERGAKLISVMPSAYSLTLQMPRGNLETIFPRALVLAGIRKSITVKDYKKAFLACRNHRVDMNILHDYAPAQFLTHVALFIKQLKKSTHIDLFLSGLKEDDVAETMYKETLNAPKLGLHGETVGTEVPTATVQTPTGGSKINRICDAFLTALESKQDTHLQNIVTAHVCKSPPDLESGLKLVAKLRETQPELADKAIEHICFLADVNRLYDTALGLYNLDVAVLVAQQSQKDPREYLPYLQSLEGMSQLRRQYTIDHDLKRYGKALTHLFTMDGFEELKSYASKHSLHTQAIELYKYQAPRLNELMRLYADYLSSLNRFRDAGIAYEYLSEYRLASDSYLAANMWQECLSSATFASYSAAELNTLASSLAEGLLESKDYFSSATITLDYLHDVPTAVRSFAKGHYYATALRISGLHNRADLLPSVLDPALGEGFASMTELLSDMKTQLQAQIPRLRDLRIKKAADPLSFFDGAGAGAADGVDIPDNISLAPTDATTSAGTFMTRYTNRSTGTLATNATRKTSKNRRREERKRARGKKGSVYEEEYLVNSIGRLIERVNSVGEEMGRLVEGLMRRGMRERAVNIGASMEEVVGLCRGCLDEVWDEKKAAEEVKQEGVEDVLEEDRRMPRPVVKAFERLSLIA